MKKYILFAGVNGAGKTTLYHTNDEFTDMPRVNIDEIVRGFGSWDNPADVIRAGMIAVNTIREYFEKEISFNQETTLCGQSIMRNITKAKSLGYEIDIYYVGLNSVRRYFNKCFLAAFLLFKQLSLFMPYTTFPKHVLSDNRCSNWFFLVSDGIFVG